MKTLSWHFFAYFGHIAHNYTSGTRRPFFFTLALVNSILSSTREDGVLMGHTRSFADIPGATTGFNANGTVNAVITSGSFDANISST